MTLNRASIGAPLSITKRCCSGCSSMPLELSGQACQKQQVDLDSQLGRVSNSGSVASGPGPLLAGEAAHIHLSVARWAVAAGPILGVRLRLLMMHNGRCQSQRRWQSTSDSSGGIFTRPNVGSRSGQRAREVVKRSSHQRLRNISDTSIDPLHCVTSATGIAAPLGIAGTLQQMLLALDTPAFQQLSACYQLH
jgi:hypothetical protein